MSELPISADLTTTHQQCLHWRPQPVNCQESSQRNDDCEYEESDTCIHLRSDPKRCRHTTFGSDGIVQKIGMLGHVWVDLTAQTKNVCSLQDLDWIEVRQSSDPNLETASGL